MVDPPCFKIGNRASILPAVFFHIGYRGIRNTVLGHGIPMVRFQCDGKIMVRKANFFEFCIEISSFI